MTEHGVKDNAPRRNYAAVVAMAAGILTVIVAISGAIIPAIVIAIITVAAAVYGLGKRFGDRGRAQAIVGLAFGAVAIIFLLYSALT